MENILKIIILIFTFPQHDERRVILVVWRIWWNNCTLNLISDDKEKFSDVVCAVKKQQEKLKNK